MLSRRGRQKSAEGLILDTEELGSGARATLGSQIVVPNQRIATVDVGSHRDCTLIHEAPLVSVSRDPGGKGRDDA